MDMIVILTYFYQTAPKTGTNTTQEEKQSSENPSLVVKVKSTKNTEGKEMFLSTLLLNYQIGCF